MKMEPKKNYYSLRERSLQVGISKAEGIAQGTFY